MTKKSDFLFWNLKKIYPSLCRPLKIDEEIWSGILEPYSELDIYAALKEYRQSPVGARIPLPRQFEDFLKMYARREVDNSLPPSPECYLIEEDKREGRCKHFFPTYKRGVEYVLNVKLKLEIGEEEFNKMTRGMRYQAAVDNGLFADFDEVLDYVYKEGY